VIIIKRLVIMAQFLMLGYVLLHFSTLIVGDLLSEQFLPPPGNAVGHSAPPKEVLDCLVCRSLVDEIEAAIDKVNPNKKVEVGSYRLDSNGNMKQAKVPYKRSELHLSEVMDNVCAQFKDYVVARYKSSGQPTLLRLTTSDGNLNPEISDVDLTPLPDTNTKLGFLCQNVVEDYEDEIVSMFVKNESDSHRKLCVKLASLCPAGSDAEQTADAETYNFEQHEEL